jgi:hypothetical protein
MAFLGFLVGVFIALGGVAAFVHPETVDQAIEVLHAPMALYVDALTRIVVGIVILRGAPVSRVPMTLHIFGVALIVSGMFMPMLGAENYRWFVDFKLGLIRHLWAVMALIFGALLAYAFIPRRSASRLHDEKTASTT